MRRVSIIPLRAKRKGGEGVVRDANGGVKFNEDLLAPEDRSAA
jgi:hypothetical protein